MENNKLVASILLAGLIAMLSGTFAKIIYGGHSSTDSERGYSIEVVDANDSNNKKEEINILELIANADANVGTKVAKKCLACHSFEKGGANKVGPNLWNILGNKPAANDEFQYSKAFLELNEGWDYKNLWAFINNPSKNVPGTKMAFAGVKKPQQLADLLAYMRTLSEKPYPLPKIEPKIEVENAEEIIEDTAANAISSNGNKVKDTVGN